MSFQKRIGSFRHAFNGIALFLKSEVNGRIHAAATVALIIIACWLKCSAMEWVALTIVTGMVWLTEMLNTAIEKTMDLVHPDIHPKVKWIKDVSAGAVLISAITAVITAAFIFLPKIS